MYQQYWGLAGRPFPSRVGLAEFFESPLHEEALARLQFLIEQRYRVGLLLGPAGSGKSLLLNVFAQMLRRSGRQAAVVSLVGLDVNDFVSQLASQLAVNPARGPSPEALWLPIVDQIVANRYQRRDTVLLLDDADEAADPVLARIARLVECDTSPESRLTAVLAAESQRPHRVGRRLLDLTELKIEIEPWTSEETGAFLRHALLQAGRDDAIFDAGAVDRLHQLTNGVPRRICQLAELSLAAGAGQDEAEIDGETVEAVFEELAIQVL
jgi:type II secretory pathway predicted ATPase ExeA